MVISDKFKCKNCNSIIEWERILPQKLGSGTLHVDYLDENKHHPKVKTKLQNNEYLLSVRCKNCDSINEFTYKTDKRL